MIIMKSQLNVRVHDRRNFSKTNTKGFRQKTEIIIMIGSNKTIKNHVLSLTELVYKITN